MIELQKDATCNEINHQRYPNVFDQQIYPKYQIQMLPIQPLIAVVMGHLKIRIFRSKNIDLKD